MSATREIVNESVQIQQPDPPFGATKREGPRRRKLSAICMQLPETERKLSGDHADFRVRGKVFAYFLNNHHGDRIVAVTAIVHSSYRLAAPRKLVRALDGEA